MAAVGGSVLAVNIDGREYPVAADADINRKLGGYENEVLEPEAILHFVRHLNSPLGPHPK